MKLTITFKDPDGVYECIRQTVEEQLRDVEGIDDEERESLAEDRKESIEESISKWVKYREYITIEFDTDAGTATVVRR